MIEAELEARLKKIERANGLLVVLGGVLAGGLIVSLAMAHPKPKGAAKLKVMDHTSQVLDEVRTKKLVIVDEDGRDRGCWLPNGIQIADEEMKRHLSVGATGLSQVRAKGRSHVRVGHEWIDLDIASDLMIEWSLGKKSEFNEEYAKERKGPGLLSGDIDLDKMWVETGSKLVLSGIDGKNRIVLSATTSESRMDISHEDGANSTMSSDGITGRRDDKVRWGLMANDDGDVFLSLFDSQGHSRAGMALFGNEANFTLKDAEGNRRAVLGAHSTILINKDQTVSKPESAISLFDKDGKVMWQAP